jgi:hypothetical protein
MRTKRLLAIALCAPLIAAFAYSNRAAETLQQAETLSPETLVLKVGSRPVFWPEFRFWLNYLGNYYQKAHALSDIGDWTATQKGRELKEFFLSTATAYACNDTAIADQAEKLGIRLLDTDLAQIAKARLDGINNYGGYAEYQRIVGSMYGSEAQYEYLTKIDYLSGYLFNHLYGADGAKCTDECVAAYVAQQGFMNARYLFLSNRDASGHEISAQRRRANRALLRHILGQLDAARAPQTMFAALSVKYGDHVTLANFPAGHLFTRDSKGPEFAAAYRGLADYEYSRIVQADEGDYIILRMPIAPDMKVGAAEHNLRYWAAYEYLYKKQITDWCGRLSIEYGDAYRQIDVEELFEQRRLQ